MLFFKVNWLKFIKFKIFLM